MQKMMMKALYKSNASRDVGSLDNYKVLIHRSNVNGKVKGKFEAHEDFVNTVGTELQV